MTMILYECRTCHGYKDSYLDPDDFSDLGIKPCTCRNLTHDPRIFGAAKVGCEAVHQREDKLKPMGAVVFDGWLNKYPGHLPTLYDGADRAKSMLGMTGKTLRVRVYEVTEETP